MMFRLSALFFLGAAGSTLAAYDNTVYLIRHGEKPADDGQGLAPQGEERAQCLTKVFGLGSGFDIGYILAETPQSDGDRMRPVETVTPLAQGLGLTVDTTCDRDDSKCVAKAVKAFAKTTSTNILICWEHNALKDILKSLGVKKPPHYPDDAFDIIWTVEDKKLVSQTSENCTGLDGLPGATPRTEL